MSNRPEYRRPHFEVLLSRSAEPRKFVQVVAGPRQVGKTTLARQVLDVARCPSHYASADEPAGRDAAWLASQWEIGRLRAEEGRARGALLVLDEAQKITSWSVIVKQLWDEDTRARIPLRVFLLGSAPLLVQRGLTESLAGRFELIRIPHWSYAEMRAAFGFDEDRLLYFGGYPGAAGLSRDWRRWRQYILDSLVETTVSRDILLMSRVDKPALLRRLFGLACDYSAQVLSYRKMLGQLDEAGNTTTLAHYLELLSGAGMVAGLEKFSGSRARQRGSSPKLLVLNTALMTASSGLSFREAREDRGFWGRVVESAVGAHLLNAGAGEGIEVFYWRHRDREVDYVIRAGRRITAIEVKSGNREASGVGLEACAKNFKVQRKLLVGGQGIPLGEFLSSPPSRWLE